MFSNKYIGIGVLGILVVAAGIYLAYSKWGYGNNTESPGDLSEEMEAEIDVQNEEASLSETTDETPNKEPNSHAPTGDGADDFGACEDDAHIYCEGFYTTEWELYATENDYTISSWKYGLLDCLEAHENETSQACKDSLERRAELNANMNETCAIDRNTYCKGVEPRPGSEPQVDCLKENYENLSAECAAALDAHEEAKPI